MKKFIFSGIGILSIALLFSFNRHDEGDITVLAMNPADIHYTANGDIDETPVRARVISEDGRLSEAGGGGEGGEGTGTICPGTGHACSLIVMYQNNPIIFVGLKGKGRKNYE